MGVFESCRRAGCVLKDGLARPADFADRDTLADGGPQDDGAGDGCEYRRGHGSGFAGEDRLRLAAVDEDQDALAGRMHGAEIADEVGGGGKIQRRRPERDQDGVRFADGGAGDAAGSVIRIGYAGRAVDQDDIVILTRSELAEVSFDGPAGDDFEWKAILAAGDGPGSGGGLGIGVDDQDAVLKPDEAAG